MLRVFKKIKSWLSGFIELPNALMGLISTSRDVRREVQVLKSELQRIREVTGATLQKIHEESSFKGLQEFKVYSQWGEDGILSSLLSLHNIQEKVFVEFGVENYVEANTRWLLVNGEWTGLIIDGSEYNINQIKSSELPWRYRLKAVCSMVTKENINGLLLSNGIRGEIGILSIDIDGVDYWVWKEINVVSPVIVVVEYNSLLGPDQSLTVPYRPDFVRGKAHHSCLYYGASLEALVRLGREKGYAFVGSNAAGNNAFFVRADKKHPKLKELTAKEGFRRRIFSESRDESGNLIYLSFDEEAKILQALPFQEV